MEGLGRWVKIREECHEPEIMSPKFDRQDAKLAKSKSS